MVQKSVWVMGKISRSVLIVLFIFLLLLTLGWWEFLGKRKKLPAAAQLQSENAHDYRPATSVLLKILEVPWAIDFLPDQKIIFTEREGGLFLADLKQKNPKKQKIAQIKEVAQIGEGGLHGLAVHPQFLENNFIYLYFTYNSGEKYFNKVVRFVLENEKLRVDKTILDAIPADSIHDGGRLRFGPDALLYVTTGDADNSELAQNINSLAGKILRLKDDGTIPGDNPFKNSYIYSYGHRNPQGIAWDAQGALWALEHGPSGHDEINLIKAGGNYGWPDVQGKQTKKDAILPILDSGHSTWAPAGAEIVDGVLYFCGLRGRSLYAFDLSTKTLKKFFHKDFGRLRDIRRSKDNLLYISTSNKDGRGVPNVDYDMIIVVDPKAL
jgi:glucose/arabinose dehydrogenase